MTKLRYLLACLALAISLPATAQWGGVYSTRSAGGGATDVGSLITAPCTTSAAVLYNSAAPCSANLTFNPTGSLLTIGADAVISRYAAKQVMISGDGTGATTNAGLILGYYGSTGNGAIWSSNITPAADNYALRSDGASTVLNGSTGGVLSFRIANANVMQLRPTGVAGEGAYITPGTATTDVAALNLTQTWNNAAVTFTGIKSNVTNTASGASSLLMDLQAGGSSKFQVSKVGDVVASGGIRGATLQAGTGVYVISEISSFGLYVNGGFGIGSTDTALSRISAGVIGVGTGAAGSVAGTLAATNYRIAANPVISGTAPTVASGGCAGGAGTVITNSNGTAYITVTVGTGCAGSQPIVLGMPTATTGWNCYARDVSNGAISSPRQSGAVSTTSVTITNYVASTGLAGPWSDSDVVVVSCLGG